MQQEGLLSGEEEHKEKSINLLTYIVVSVIDRNSKYFEKIEIFAHVVK